MFPVGNIKKFNDNSSFLEMRQLLSYINFLSMKVGSISIDTLLYKFNFYYKNIKGGGGGSCGVGVCNFYLAKECM